MRKTLFVCALIFSAGCTASNGKESRNGFFAAAAAPIHSAHAELIFTDKTRAMVFADFYGDSSRDEVEPYLAVRMIVTRPNGTKRIITRGRRYREMTRLGEKDDALGIAIELKDKKRIEVHIRPDNWLRKSAESPSLQIEGRNE